VEWGGGLEGRAVLAQDLGHFRVSVYGIHQCHLPSEWRAWGH
jgi:hypothetical protein